MKHLWNDSEKRSAYYFLAGAAALMLLAAAGAAVPARADDPAPTTPAPAAVSVLAPAGVIPEIDPLKYMPSSTMMYFNINVDAGKQFVDSMKNTRLGQDISRSMAASKNAPDTRNLKMLQAMMQGFGHHVGIGVILPPAMQAAVPPNPTVFGVVPVTDPAAVKTEVKFAVAYLTNNNKVTWTDEPDGDTVVHVATPAQKGPISPAYALTNDALLIGSSGAQVHAMLHQGAGGGDSLEASGDFQNVLAHVDRTQFAWGYVNGARLMANMPSFSQIRAASQKAAAAGAAGAGGAGAAAGAGGAAGALPDFDPTTIPVIKAMLQANRGVGFTLGLHPDHIDLQSFASYDPASDLGKLMAGFKGTPLKAPDLVFGHPLFFLDFADMPQWATLYTQIFKPVLAAVNTAMEKNPDTAMAGPVLGMMTPVLDDIVNGSGNELAFAIGPMAAGAKTPIPPLALLIQKSDNPRLDQGIRKVLDLASSMSSEKWYPKDIIGTKVMILGPASSPVRPAYAPVGDFHVLAMDLGSLKTPLYLAAGAAPGKSLSANPDFQKITGMLGAQAISTMYLDLHAIARMGAFAAARAAAGKYTKVPAAGASTANDALQAELASAVGQVGAASYPDPAGIGSKVVLTFDPDAVPEAPVAVAR